MQTSSTPVKPDPAPSKRTIRGLNSLLFFISDVRHGVGPLLSIYLEGSLKWDAARIGITLAMTDVSSAIAQTPAGLLVDTTKYKRFLIALSCLLIMSGCILILNHPTFGIIISAQLVMGIAIAMIPPTIGGITLGLFGRRMLPKRASQNEMWNHAGNVFTAFSAGLLGYLLGYQWIFYTVIILGLLSLISLSFIRPKEIDHNVARELIESPLQSQIPKPTPLKALLRRKAVLIFNASMILYYMTNGAQIALVGQLLAHNYPGSGAFFLAACMIIAELVMILVAYIMSHVVYRFGRKQIFLTAFIILPIRAFLYTVTDNAYLLLAIQILDGTAAGILGVIGTVINSDLAIGTGRFNFLQGLGSLSTSIGFSLSNVFAGFVAKSLGFNAAFLALAGIGIVGVLFFLILMPETKNHAISEP
ncbi:MFS transporter [Candidatus Protochlamydia phocaeensis]|uniref:MFS transporter n=1 Tax=Candidatus Protochlamydia phocaeensis TaxID=1414722 RepID=UPI000839A1BA|nr:MFS transporter [Candidatus Protochlamydia phocaeensis]